MSVITVSVVEDDERAAHRLDCLVSQSAGLRLASRHATAEEALGELPAIQPRVTLVDLQLPGLGGVECIRRLKRLLPDTLCLVLTRFDDGDRIFAALQAGADGYLLKRASDEEILEAIRCVAAGGGAMAPSVSRKVLEYFHNAKPAPEAQSVLSEREIAVLQLARRGKRPKEIADALGLSPHTVRTHFRNVYKKLHVGGRRAALDKTFGEAD